MKAKLVKESLIDNNDENEKIIDFVENYGFQLNPDFDVETNVYGRGYDPDEYAKLYSYNFTLGEELSRKLNKAIKEDGYDNVNLALEILVGHDDRKYIQFYTDASPLVTGSPKFLDPGFIPEENLDDDFMKRVYDRFISYWS